MPLDPQAEALLLASQRAGLPPINSLDPPAARRQMLNATAALDHGPAVHHVEDRTIAGPASEIPIRIYRPDGGGLAVVVYFHGGGWVIGDIDTHDAYCRCVANDAQAVVVSVDYRLAPEHPYPAAIDDSYAATCWVADHIDELGGRADAIAVAGDSAGGNLAAGVAIMARDRGGPPIAQQILIYPITDCDFDTESYREFETGFFLTRDAMEWFWDLYCPAGVDRRQSNLAPLRADHLGDLPPALVMTAECDPLRDEGEAYAQRLQAAGVDVQLTCYGGMLHGFVRHFGLVDKADAALREVVDAVKV